MNQLILRHHAQARAGAGFGFAPLTPPPFPNYNPGGYNPGGGLTTIFGGTPPPVTTTTTAGGQQWPTTTQGILALISQGLTVFGPRISGTGGAQQLSPEQQLLLAQQLAAAQRAREEEEGTGAGFRFTGKGLKVGDSTITYPVMGLGVLAIFLLQSKGFTRR